MAAEKSAAARVSPSGNVPIVLAPGERYSRLHKASKESVVSEAKATILLVDDNESLRGFLLFMLQAQGYDVTAAADGPEALEFLRSRTGRIDVLLSDIQMPGISGMELAAKVQLESPATLILLMSGFAGMEVTVNDAWEFIPKPFTREELHMRLQAMLHRTARDAGHADGPIRRCAEGAKAAASTSTPAAPGPGKAAEAAGAGSTEGAA
jgi:DNA-binding response OmpR family regulator